ncbi:MULTISPECIES: hypothetical protein [Streptomyces]|uniref:Large membrane protein n=1 Tax=Streptomyces solicathayae TaxID=3081768 RepID=A0ABZ0M4Q7_9ACTN|nr:hypothetical protein [Streptomyces sp. HUAS YS2]WOX26767.1 hypothetical protein R2D22_26895 [Streptomyces sp. HUAS YS2]
MPGTAEAPGPDDAPEGARRRSRLVVASVAVAALLIGGGGAYWASTASDGGRGTDDRAAAADAAGTPPPLVLDGQGDGGPGIAPGEPDPSGAVYKAEGPLPKGPAKAAVHRAQGKVTAAEVTRLAETLGISGTPRLSGTQWRIAPEKDAGGARLDVAVEAPGTWSFTVVPGAEQGDTCSKGPDCPAPGGKLPGGTPVDEAAAKAAAAPVLKALGQADADVDARQVMGATRVVNADPKIGGLPTYGWSTGLQVGPDGELTGGSGRLKEPVKTATYPVIGAEKALERLNEAARGTGPVDIGGCATDPAASKDGARPAPESGKHQAPCQVAYDRVAPQELTVRGAVFGLAAQFAGGREALVPSWLFEVAPTGAKAAAVHTVVQTAVAPEFLSPKPSPTPTPVPIPSDDAAPPRQLQSYTVDGTGRKLSATFWGGVCSDYGITAAESADRVTVTITETPRQPDRACIMMAVEVTKSVTLKAPLGDRQVVDSASGGVVPRQGPK